jgi:hypothetical protein
MDRMTYQIKIQGCVDPSWSDWFNGMEMSVDTGGETNCVTTFTGQVGDQATLRGVLNRLWDLNLTILSVIRVEPETDPFDMHVTVKDNDEN